MGSDRASEADATPRVSVVVPTFDCVSTVERTLASVLAQTEPHLELLVCDDGSTDGTREVVAEAARADPRVRLVPNPSGGNGGPGAARNRGLAAARGDLVAFLDADDLWAPTLVHDRLEWFDRHPDVGLVWGACHVAYPHDPAKNFDRGAEPDVAFVEDGVGAVSRWLRQLRYAPNPSQVMMRTALARSVGGWSEHLRRTEDTVFHIQVAALTRVAYDPRSTVTVHRHGASSTSRMHDQGTIAGHDVDAARAIVDLTRQSPSLRRFTDLAASHLELMLWNQAPAVPTGRLHILRGLAAQRGARHRLRAAPVILAAPRRLALKAEGWVDERIEAIRFPPLPPAEPPTGA